MSARDLFREKYDLKPNPFTPNVVYRRTVNGYGVELSTGYSTMTEQNIYGVTIIDPNNIDDNSMNDLFHDLKEAEAYIKAITSKNKKD